MISLGGFLLALSLGSCLFFFWGRRLYTTRWLLWLLVPGPVYTIAANLAGWWTAEIGRQPFMVYNLLRTTQGVSPNVPSPLYIGAGASFLPVGPQPSGGPQWPFRGKIQDVAIYNAALSLDDIIKHKANGEGVST